MTLKLYAFPPSPRAFKVLFVANHLGLDYELKLVDLTKGEQNAPAYAALNPNKRMPTLDDDGFILWESNAIALYLAQKRPEAGLLPAELKGRMAIEKWLFWESNHWDPACAVLVYERFVKAFFGRGGPTPSEEARGTEMLARLGPVLDGELAKHRYVAGDTLSLADLCIAASLTMAEPARFPLEDYRGIQRWQAEMKSLPAWQKTVAMQGR
jgi:glutathione S-transferase